MTVLQQSVNTLKLILIVDDIEDNRILLERALRSSGFETVSAASGREALSVLSRVQPAMVLLDWMMPELSGLETLRAIRETYPRSKLPVIMCTAVGEEMSVVAALHAGANDYITKPISIPILRARMTTLFDQVAVIDALDTQKDEVARKLSERTRALLGSVPPLPSRKSEA
ncbi:MAG TPA: response regulator [Sphingomicrobium sp.]|nr:response regulator [Sphingomicrobium sp.]